MGSQRVGHNLATEQQHLSRCLIPVPKMKTDEWVNERMNEWCYLWLHHRNTDVTFPFGKCPLSQGHCENQISFVLNPALPKGSAWGYSRISMTERDINTNRCQGPTHRDSALGGILHFNRLPRYVGKESVCQCRRHKRHGFTLWVRKISWSRKGQSTPVFLPGEPPWTEEPGRLRSMRLQRVRHDWALVHRILTNFSGGFSRKPHLEIAGPWGLWSSAHTPWPRSGIGWSKSV